MLWSRKDYVYNSLLEVLEGGSSLLIQSYNVN